MSVLMGLDQHRVQITAEWIDTETNLEAPRGQWQLREHAFVDGFRIDHLDVRQVRLRLRPAAPARRFCSSMAIPGGHHSPSGRSRHRGRWLPRRVPGPAGL